MDDESITGSGQQVDAIKLEKRLTRLDVSGEVTNVILKDMAKVLRSMDESNRVRNGRMEKLEHQLVSHHLDHAEDNLRKRVGDLELRHQISDGLQQMGWKMLMGGISLIAAASSAGGAVVAFFLR